MSARQERTHAFTLIELLVVVAILSILMGLVVVGVTQYLASAHLKKERVNLQQLAAAVQTYADRWGDFPPSRLVELQSDSVSNGVNEGAECLLWCLSSPSRAGPYHEPTEAGYANVDGDRGFEATDSRLYNEITRENFEVVDSWGNPYVYLHWRHYEGGAVKVRGLDGKVQTVEAVRGGKSGRYRGDLKFQLRSMGPNGLDEGGEGDDIASWHEVR
ncbi:MAG: prepilin-type N-terminal cleavage/methylation domain-containing protein [Planctomycetes bacterium]|nr:prepilin-type N-terminal cleavage/methylation domain-containing protein [Planctomycetota bacterium]